MRLCSQTCFAIRIRNYQIKFSLSCSAFPGLWPFHHLLGRESPPCLLNAVQTHLLVPPFYITGKKPEIHSVRVTRPQSHTGLPTRLTTSVPFLLASSSNLHPLRAASLCHREQPLQAHECQSIKTDKREKGTKLVGPCVLLGQPETTSSLIIKTIMVLTMPAAGTCSQAPPRDDDDSGVCPRLGEGPPGTCELVRSLLPLR